jgi:hypothetical protein
MRLGLLLLILIATIFGSGYWYSLFDTTCKVPIHYRVGTIDPKFGTNREDVIRIAKNAEMIWETPLSKDLFIYDESSSLPINFVFDERQQNTVIAEELKEDLAQKEGMSESVAKQYETLIGNFRTLKKKYESEVVSYEGKLETYNTEVEAWNKKGGAPENVIAKLTETQELLAEKQVEIESLGKKLNEIVAQLNAIGAKGNSLITDYNTTVNDYNNRFAEAHEFTQGDYMGTAINIYQFNAEDELTVVLAHEFGHALSLDHVPEAHSIMYYFMDKQQVGTGLSSEDIAEFNRICEDKSITERLFTLTQKML